MNQIILNIDDLKLLVDSGNRILMSPDGEELLVKLLKHQEEVEKAVNTIKKNLALKIDEMNPELSSITSDKVKVMYRVYGAKYNLVETAIDQIDERYYTKKMTYLPNAVEIDKNLRETNTLPSGIDLNARTKTVSISLKENKEKEE